MDGFHSLLSSAIVHTTSLYIRYGSIFSRGSRPLLYTSNNILNKLRQIMEHLQKYKADFPTDQSSQ